jgi:hypothetical protein
MTASEALLSVLEEARTHTRGQLTALKRTIGFNMAALQYLKRELEVDGGLPHLGSTHGGVSFTPPSPHFSPRTQESGFLRMPTRSLRKLARRRSGRWARRRHSRPRFSNFFFKKKGLKILIN